MNTQNQNNLLFENNSKTNIAELVFLSVLEVVIQQEELPKNAIVNLLISDGDEIQEINRKYRGVDNKTDVISFPAETPDRSYLGDIIIDIEIADSQKGIYTLEEELRVLFLHGVLHLLGYDHLSARQKKIMESKEKNYLVIIKEKG